MNYSTEYMCCKFDIEYSVNDDGDYEEFIIEVAGQPVNDVLSQAVIDVLEADTWDNGYIPDCKSHNDDLKIERWLSAVEA